MKKRISVLVFLILSIFLISCTSQKETDSKLEEKENTSKIVTGRIIIVGNEPFTKPAVIIDDSTSYIILASEEIENELKVNQGYDYSITYNGKKNVAEGKAIEVIKVEKTNK